LLTSLFLLWAQRDLKTRLNSAKSGEKQANEREVAPNPESVGGGSRGCPDAALTSAIKAAVDAGLYDRARALLEVLAKTSEPADVVDLRERRRT
jgi:hypothetical protein